MYQKISGDITRLPFHVDAIVNSAHPTLLAGGGVCGAIHEAAGPGLQDECEYLMFNLDKTTMHPAQPVVTTAHRLNAECVIHVVAVNLQGKEPTLDDMALLRDCYTDTLKMAKQLGCESIAFPLLGAGIYGWNKETAISIAESALEQETDLDVYLVIYE